MDLKQWLRSCPHARRPGGAGRARPCTVLDLARDAAHEVERPAAPLTTFLVGVAVGRGATLEGAASTATALLLDTTEPPSALATPLAWRRAPSVAPLGPADRLRRRPRRGLRQPRPVAAATGSTSARPATSTTLTNEAEPVRPFAEVFTGRSPTPTSGSGSRPGHVRRRAPVRRPLPPQRRRRRATRWSPRCGPRRGRCWSTGLRGPAAAAGSPAARRPPPSR